VSIRSFESCGPLGAFYTKVDPKNGLETLLAFAAQRAKAHPIPYAHWYIDGARKPRAIRLLLPFPTRAWNRLANCCCKSAEAQRLAWKWVRRICARPWLALRPSDLQLDKIADPVLSRFVLKCLTEGSGTQIFSTTFCAMGCARSVAARATAYACGAIRSASAAETDERNAGG